jgi:hypothetical protein
VFQRAAGGCRLIQGNYAGGLTIVSSGFDTKSIAPPIPLTNLFGIMKLA